YYLMSPVYQNFREALNQLVENGHTLAKAIEIMSQRYDQMAGQAAKALREKQGLEKDLRNCQRQLQQRNS
ncbi:MAG: hypothetical protein PUP91_26700, partial [Rhizonema sp. PD37]|nr:hypothetical protein [Rhizonema sp. PD37]